MATSPNPPGTEQQEYELNEIIRDFEMAEAEDRHRLEEQIFVQVFLPFFRDNKNNPYNVNIGHWMTVAGSVFNSVDIVDRAGNVLFTVPPLHDRDAIIPLEKSRGERSVLNMITLAEQMKRISPRDADRQLQQGLGEMLDTMAGKPRVLEKLNNWNEIFKRYNLEPVMDGLPAPKEEQAEQEKVKHEAKPHNEDDWELL